MSDSSLIKAMGQLTAIAYLFTSAIFFIYMLMKVPFAGAYWLSYGTLGVFKRIFFGVLALLAFVRILDKKGEELRKRSL